MSATTFDDLDNDTTGSKARKPFFAVQDQDDDALLTWLKTELEHLEKEDEERIRKIKNNIARYKGIQYQAQETRGSGRDRENKNSKFAPKMVINTLFDVTEQKIARLIEYKPAVAVLPTNDEFSDKVAAITAKRFLGHIDYTQNFDEKAHTTLRNSKLSGEGFMTVMWNPDIGGFHPDYDPEVKQEYLNEKGEAERQADGSKKYIDRPVYRGDVEYKLWRSDDVFVEEASSWDCVNYAFLRDREYTEALKLDHPSKASLIKEDGQGMAYDYASLQDKPLINKTNTYLFIHKRTKYCKNGAKIKFCKDAILSKEDLPQEFDNGTWPLTRLPDIELTGENRGESFFMNVKAMASQYNNLTNMINRNQLLVSHPKWFVWGGSVDNKNLNNDISIVTVKGPKAPVLAQANPTPAEVFNFRKELKEEIYQMGQIPSVQRGEAPAGVKAMVALQFLTEQETRRQNTDITRFNSWVRDVKALSLKVAGKRYKKDDKRTMMILGRDSTWFAKNYDPAKLSRSFDVRIQNTSALPESKGARWQFILDMAERFPDLFPREQIVEMLELGQVDKFMDEASNAVRTAEYENEVILEGEELPEPEKYEFHIIHWKTHVKAIQDLSFKKNTPKEIRQKMIDHIMATEMLMLDEAEKSPEFAKALTMLQQFPMFMEPPPPPPPMPPMPEQLPPEMAGAPSLLPGDMAPPQGLPPDPLMQGMPVGEPQVINAQSVQPIDPTLL